MTISTISSGVGLKTLTGNDSSSDAKRGVAPQRSDGEATASAEGSEAPAIRINSTATPPNLDRPSAPPVQPVVNGLGQGLRFSTDQVTGTPIITVINVDSGEVVRQIPSEEVLDFMRHFSTVKGQLISRKL